MLKVRDLDDNIINWNTNGCSQTAAAKSSLHLEAREILKDIFPTFQILEEVPVHIRKNDIIYLDFYIPLIKTCVEVHGEQHYKFVPYFHTNIVGFARSKLKDKEKKLWCEINNISFIELPFNEKNKWREIIYEIS